jgi:hypothetical protein
VSAALPEIAERFVRRHIRSIGELEVLVLLARDPQRWWSADAVNDELRASVESSRQHLRNLVTAYLVEHKGFGKDAVFRFCANDPATAHVVHLLAQLLKYRLPALIQLIYEPAYSPVVREPDRVHGGQHGPSTGGRFDRRR